MFDRALPLVLKYEGGYVNDPLDPGGATNFGITQRVYDGYRLSKRQAQKSVRWISQEEVEAIYKQNYWLDGKCHKIAETHKYLAIFHFDTAVNTGIGQAAKLLQRSINVVDDGIIGPKTLAQLDKLIEFDIIEIYVEERNRFYRGLVRRRRSSLKFLLGWLVRVARLEGTLHEYAANDSQ